MNLSYECRRGNCTSCAAKIQDGERMKNCVKIRSGGCLSGICLVTGGTTAVVRTETTRRRGYPALLPWLDSGVIPFCRQGIMLTFLLLHIHLEKICWSLVIHAHYVRLSIGIQEIPPVFVNWLPPPKKNYTLFSGNKNDKRSEGPWQVTPPTAK